MLRQEWIAPLLQRGREHLGMELGWVAQHEADGFMRVVHVDGVLASGPIAVGTQLEYEATFCAQVVGAGSTAVAVADLGADTRTVDLPVRTELGIGSYVGAPILLHDGTRYGMLCCFSTEPNPDLQAAQARVLAFIADLIAKRLDEQIAAEAERTAVQDRIRRVLANGGPRIEFQAVFDLPSLTVRGWEALARFPGNDTPDSWFAQAAVVGLGADLELAAISNALAQLPLLPAGSRIGVNVSPATLTDQRLLDFLAGLDPASVLIEITEHEAIADYAALAVPLARLRQLGIPTAADDTGSGYAGLRHLVELRPTGIKLDRAIVAGIDRDPARRAVAAAMVAYSAETNTILLAEGVETLDELTTLYDLGITVAQGYLLHHPQTIYPNITIPVADTIRAHLINHDRRTPLTGSDVAR